MKSSKRVNFQNSTNKDHRNSNTLSIQADNIIPTPKKSIQRDSSIGRSMNNKSFMGSTTSSQKMLKLEKSLINPAQKIKIMLINTGFIIERKYLSAELQVMLSISNNEKYNHLYIPSPKNTKLIMKHQQIHQQNHQNQLTILMLTESNKIYLVMNGIKHKYTINSQQHNRQFIQFRFPDNHEIKNIVIANRRIQFIEINDEKTTNNQYNQQKQGTYNQQQIQQINNNQYDPSQFTIMQPIKLLMNSLQHRQKCLNKSQNKLNITWNTATTNNKSDINCPEKPQNSRTSKFSSQNSVNKYKRFSSIVRSQIPDKNQHRKRNSHLQQTIENKNINNFNINTDLGNSRISNKILGANITNSSNTNSRNMKRQKSYSTKKQNDGIKKIANHGYKQHFLNTKEKQNKNQQYYRINTDASKLTTDCTQNSKQINKIDQYGLID